MPSWVNRETDHGDTAAFKVELHNGTVIEGFLQDNDGDGTTYEVKENGTVIAQGHEHLWDEAKRIATLAIITNRVAPQPKPVALEKEASTAPRIVKSFAEIGGEPVRRKHDHLDAPKKKGNKREKGDRRKQRDDEWADA